MWIDLHCHEQTYSSCSHVALADMVREAKRKGLDAMCITDHDSMGLRQTAAAFSKESGYPIFIGTEVYTFEGDILVFGLEQTPDRRLHLEELLQLVRRAGGVCIAAHPFRSNMRGIRENLAVLKDYADIAGVEIRNGRTTPEENQLAAARCRELGLFATGGSDGHTEAEIGDCATWLPETVKNEAELVHALRLGKSRAAVYQNGEFHIVEPDGTRQEPERSGRNA